MKRLSCLVIVAILVVSLCGCSTNGLDKASVNADVYNIVAGYDDLSHTLSCVETLQYTNRTDNSLTSVKLHVYGNAYREGASHCVVPNTYKLSAYRNGMSYGEVTFDCVKVDGIAVAYTIGGSDMDIVTVPLGKELFPNEQVTVELTYEVTLANVWHRLGYGDNTVNLANFYPVLCYYDNGFVESPYYNVGDPFVTDVANYNVTLTVPRSYTVASTGNLTDVTADDDNATYTFCAQAVRDYAIVMSANYKKLSATVDDVTVNYYYFDDADCDTSLNCAVGMLQYLNKTVGKYPYKQLSVCQADFCYGGMEYPCLVTVAPSESYSEAIIHEVAHQWFYAVVGSNQIDNAWMDEGLAEFVTMMYLDSTGERTLDASIANATKTYTTYVDVLNNYYNKADTTFRTLSAYKNDAEYVCITYVKGSLLFATLYNTMGENKFCNALKRYYTTCAFSVASPSALMECFNKVNGASVSEVFQAFVEGKEIIGKVIE